MGDIAITLSSCLVIEYKPIICTFSTDPTAPVLFALLYLRPVFLSHKSQALCRPCYLGHRRLRGLLRRMGAMGVRRDSFQARAASLVDCSGVWGLFERLKLKPWLHAQYRLGYVLTALLPRKTLELFPSVVPKTFELGRGIIRVNITSLCNLELGRSRRISLTRIGQGKAFPTPVAPAAFFSLAPSWYAAPSHHHWLDCLSPFHSHHLPLYLRLLLHF